MYCVCLYCVGDEIDDLIPSEKQVKDEDGGNFPDLSAHNNWMSKCLTPAIYNKLKNRKTPSGYTLDGCIQTGMLTDKVQYFG